MTEKVQGKLLDINCGTSTLVNDRFINTTEYGTYVFDPKKLKCEMLNEDYE